MEPIARLLAAQTRAVGKPQALESTASQGEQRDCLSSLTHLHSPGRLYGQDQSLLR
jgi:hypothetical protein